MASGYPLLVNGIRIFTTEALYQACRYPTAPEIQREILAHVSPMTAKMKAKPHRALTRGDWNDVRYKVMRWCLRVKLAQHFDEFGRLLLSTENRPIVEQSRRDDYWGAKLQPDETTLVGENVLGRLLMELRERIRQCEAEGLQSVEPLEIPDFRLAGKPIQLITSRTSKGGKGQVGLF